MTEIPVIIYKPKGINILVFAPHPDDEVLGCGGTIIKHILDGNFVTVIYMTDGRLGCPSNIELHNIVTIRRREAMSASKKLGVHNVYFAPFVDGELKLSRETLIYVEKKIKEIKPDIIYTPHPNEPHPDHTECTHIVDKAIQLSGVSTDVYFYEIWDFLKPTHLVNITDVMEGKIAALNEYTSQLFIHNYETMIKSLNAYRMQQIYDKKLLINKIRIEQRERKNINKIIRLPWKYAEALQHKSTGVKVGD